MDSFDNITRVEKNAPDKIYFPADGLPAYIDWDGSPIRTKQVEDSDICYIRKDALLEWAKKQFNLARECMVEAERDWNRAYENGEMTAYDNIIKKLNTL